MRVFVFLAVTVSLAACAVPTRRGFEQQLSAVRGEDINRIISSWGPPAKVYDMPNGDKIYTFARGSTFRTPTTTTANVAGGYGYAQGSATTSGGNVVTSFCRIDLTVSAQQRVTDYRFEGDRCVAREQKR
jgi:hypothetical protein